MIGSRVLVLALFAARFKAYIALVCLLHWLLMFAWIVTMRTKFCDNKCEELGYNAVLAVMFIFCYFNPVDSPTRFRYTIFYLISFAENVLLMCFFFVHNDSLGTWYRVPAVVVHFVAFFLGIVIMVQLLLSILSSTASLFIAQVIYYLHFHPTGAISVCGEKGVVVVDCASDDKVNQARILHPRPAVPTMSGDLPLQATDVCDLPPLTIASTHS